MEIRITTNRHVIVVEIAGCIIPAELNEVVALADGYEPHLVLQMIVTEVAGVERADVNYKPLPF